MALHAYAHPILGQQPHGLERQFRAAKVGSTEILFEVEPLYETLRPSREMLIHIRKNTVESL